LPRLPLATDETPCERVARTRASSHVRDVFQTYLDKLEREPESIALARSIRGLWTAITVTGFLASCVLIAIAAVLVYQYSALMFALLLAAAVPLILGTWALAIYQVPTSMSTGVTNAYQSTLATLRAEAYAARADHLRHHTRGQYDTIECDGHDGLTDGRPLGPVPDGMR
jgi:hypothetical protein